MKLIDGVEFLQIGEVAKKTGLSIKTIRYYAELDLLTPSLIRAKSGYRLFQFSVFNRLAFIRRAQSLGLTLKEIKEILFVHDSGHIPCGVIKQLLLDKLQKVNQQIKELKIFQGELAGIISGWQDLPSPESFTETICPNLQAWTTTSNHSNSAANSRQPSS
jgi:DNA-binding transcriptional MerR regulator